ncbi:MAG: YgiQ family radical SAM protein [Victivallaceae bacterium]|nr:YgiQ family radical SAM protein [Victivallaceae bacterium]
MSTDKQQLLRFLPTSREEMEARGWDALDIILVSGDAYVDHPAFGVSIIGRVLEHAGYRVGVIAQPDWKTPESLRIMGPPRLGWGVTGGNIDSIVNVYTVGRRFRKDDAYSEDGQAGKRPPNAEVIYSQLCHQAYKGLPVVQGGIGASMRRVAHFDYFLDRMRPSILADSKADILCFGMGERTMPEIFRRIAAHEPLRGIRGTAVLLKEKESCDFDTASALELPSYEDHLTNRFALMESTKLVESQMNALNAQRLFQRHGKRILVVEPPAEPLTTEELDSMHTLPFAMRPHFRYRKRIPAFETVQYSIMAVRGCPGGCAFCGLVTHQGRQVMSRSKESILAEARSFAEDPNFKGTISDIGGAAGNIYASCSDREFCEKCRRVSCLFPTQCPHYHCDGLALTDLLRKVSAIPRVKHVYINSGIRLELALKQKEFLRELIRHHVSGHLKVAPEHLDDRVLKLMRKSPASEFYEFMRLFEEESRAAGKEQYLIPLLISNFPGCDAKAMKVVDDFLNEHHWSLQQVQDYIPLPMTMGCAMYYCGIAPDGTPIPVNRGLAARRDQIEVLKKRRTGPDKGAYFKRKKHRP